MLCVWHDIKVGTMPKQPCHQVLVILNPNVSPATLSSASPVYNLDVEYDVSTAKIKRNH